MSTKKKVWVLTDDRPGNNTQSLGVAEALGWKFDVHHIDYTSAVRLPNLVRGKGLLGVKKTNFCAPWPDVVIAAGRRLAPVARHIKKISDKPIFLVQLMDPGTPRQDFDVIVTPAHDRLVRHRGLFKTDVSPHRLTPKILKQEKQKWEDVWNDLPAPRIGLLVGGGSKQGKFTVSMAKELGAKVAQLVGAGSLLITSSRRTPAAAMQALIAALKDTKYYLYDWKKGGDNPYAGILAVADGFVVTGDSVAMCSEALGTGKPVYIYSAPKLISAKHGKFIQNLYNRSYTKPLAGKFETWSYIIPDAARDVAEFLKTKLDEV